MYKQEGRFVVICMWKLNTCALSAHREWSEFIAKDKGRFVLRNVFYVLIIFFSMALHSWQLGGAYDIPVGGTLYHHWFKTYWPYTKY